MNGLNYLLQSNLYLILFFVFYWILLRKETFNNYNRAYLVLSGLVSFAIPLWNLDLVQSWFITKHAANAIVQMNFPQYVFSNLKTENTFDITNYLSIIYGFGCFVLAAKLIMNIFNLYSFLYGINPINKAFSFFNTIFITEGLDPDDVIYNHERVHASQYHSFDVLLFEIIGIFCWFNPVIYFYKIAIKNIHEFIADDIASSKLNSKFEYAMLLFSEQFQTHPSVLVSNFFSKTSLKLRIEMLNKKRSNRVAVLKYGLIFPLFLGMMVFASVAIANGKKISELLSFNKTIEGTVLNYDFKPISGATIRIAGTFTETTTDKNGNFKLKTNSANTELVFSHVSYKTKQLSVINTEPIKVTMRRYSNELLGTFVLENQNEFLDITTNQNTVKPQITLEKDLEFSEVEKTAEYIGGSGELYGYLKSNLRYPKAARENKKQGIVYTQFMVNEKGEISDVRIANPLGYMSFLGHGLEAEAKRVVANMPNWLPARQNGEAVSSDFILPIQFILDEKEEKKNGGKTFIVDPKNNLSIDPSLYFIDGKLVTKKEDEAISPNSIESMKVLKGPEAIKKYGEKGKNGVIEIVTKSEKSEGKTEVKISNLLFTDEVFTVVEENAEFPGGQSAMEEFIGKNLKYPAPAQRANVQGKVFLSFVVSKSGEISDVQIIKGLGFGCDEEAIRLVKSMPNWKPAKQSGREVNSKFNLPISFVLDKKEFDKIESANGKEYLYIIDGKEVSYEFMKKFKLGKLKIQTLSEEEAMEKYKVKKVMIIETLK